MKYGLIFHKPTTNIGDDIQAYATKQFLPHIDYLLTRDKLDTFQSEGGEPVAAIMAAWWMWEKWNWPPAQCLIPKLISMHLNAYTTENNSSPITNEWVQGVGKEFFEAYGPVGARDSYSLKFLQDNGIDSYFSGCITLTLPKQKETADKGKYVVLADLNAPATKAAKEWLKDSGYEIREITHRVPKQTDVPFEERMERTEEILTLYQNAAFVITRRLHVTLPCLAMEVPVLSVVENNPLGNTPRWESYKDFTRYVTRNDFIKGNFEYDYKNPPANKPGYKAVREGLIKSITEFINEMESLPEDATVEQVRKTTYTEAEAKQWQLDLCKDTLEKWLYDNRKYQKELKKLKEDDIFKSFEKRVTFKDELKHLVYRFLKKLGLKK